MNLSTLLLSAAERSPDALAVIARGDRATYGELDRDAGRAAGLLRDLGVRAGDRVGIYARKGARTLAFMQGAMRLGAIYVPVDPKSPAARAAAILTGCGASAIVSSTRSLRELRATGTLAGDARFASIDDEADEAPCWGDVAVHPGAPLRLSGDDDLAYILYTSGSTGPNKGVCITHRNAASFVEWCALTLGSGPADRFANHAPYNFDLSVLDIYAAFYSGAAIVTVPEDLSYLGHRLVDLCREHGVTVWYSVPTALTLMLQDPGFTARALPQLRSIIFAGEVFPIRGVRALRQAFPDARLFNFYGPTETNVCTAYEVTTVPDDRTAPVPIGSASCGDRVWAVTSDGQEAQPGEEGELVVLGPTVARGYWGQPFRAGEPYRTGDLVRVLADGEFEYIGRVDRLLKIRGWRIDPGEIETALLTHDAIDRAAVVVEGEGLEARIVAFVVLTAEAPLPSLLELKRHCASRLPSYMNVGEVRFVDHLPRTANGKTDYRELGAAAARAAAAVGAAVC